MSRAVVRLVDAGVSARLAAIRSSTAATSPWGGVPAIQPVISA